MQWLPCRERTDFLGEGAYPLKNLPFVRLFREQTEIQGLWRLRRAALRDVPRNERPKFHGGAAFERTYRPCEQVEATGRLMLLFHASGYFVKVLHLFNEADGYRPNGSHWIGIQGWVH
jgi:hypothetical protein